MGTNWNVEYLNLSNFGGWATALKKCEWHRRSPLHSSIRIRCSNEWCPKIGLPQIIHFRLGCSIYKPSILWYLHFRKPHKHSLNWMMAQTRLKNSNYWCERDLAWGIVHLRFPSTKAAVELISSWILYQVNMSEDFTNSRNCAWIFIEIWGAGSFFFYTKSSSKIHSRTLKKTTTLW